MTTAALKSALRLSHKKVSISPPMKTLFRRPVAVSPIQVRTLPTPEIKGAELAAITQNPSDHGDACYFARGSADRMVFALLDDFGTVSNGHAFSSVPQAFQEAVARKFLQDDVNEAEAMMELALAMNLCIVRSGHGRRTVPGFIGCYNEGLGTLCYVNAGHIPGLLRFDSTMTELAATGMPLGLLTASTYEAPTAALPPGASLLVVSRAVADGSEKGSTGIPALKTAFDRAPLGPAAQIALHMLEKLVCTGRSKSGQQASSCLVLLRDATAQS